MSKSKMNYTLIIVLLLACAMQSFGQTVVPATKQQVDKLIAVLKSDAPHKEKADACRLLALVGTKDAIAPLAALLGNEKLSHMARYGLEPIPDPAVDDALRNALGKLKGRPLVGVIGSIGVRRDVKAVRPLAKMLRSPDTQVAQAAARALGKIGNRPAARVLQRALPNVSAANQLALCEGLFRCAEALAAKGRRDVAIEIYDQMRDLDAPHQVRAGALRGAILTRGKDGVALLREHLRSDDYILFSAAVQAAQELPIAEVTQALTAELNRLPADNQILIIQTLGKRADASASPALFALARNSEKSVRIAAIRSLAEIGHSSAVPVLAELLNDADSEISQAAQESLAALPGRQADAAVMAMLDSSQTSRRLTALELIGRRRMTASIPALLKAAEDAEAKVRPAALKKVGELGGPDQLPALLDLLMHFKASQDIDAAERALSAVCMKADNPQSYTMKLTSLLVQAQPAQKNALLHVLGVIGGTNALKAVRSAANDSNAQVRAAAIRVLCGWKTADAAPDLLALAKGSPNSSRNTAALRGYISLVRDKSLPTEQKLAMCKEAAVLVRRNEEKKLLLGVLGGVPAAEALAMAMTYLNDPATKNEASFAAVAISEKIVQQKPGEVADAMQKVLGATKNRNVTRRARAVLNKAKKTAGK
ncbi:MAG: HEAT repeat domain-containing protein [Planctomycetes bacterium]|nr:HEAT repeat domain-containing protein [Planctomycetota bacterium]